MTNHTFRPVMSHALGVRLTHLRSISCSHAYGWNLTHSQALQSCFFFYRVARIKNASSKFAITWQRHKILRPILQQLLSTDQRINPPNSAYISAKKTNLQYCKDESTIFQILPMFLVAGYYFMVGCTSLTKKRKWMPNTTRRVCFQVLSQTVTDCFQVASSFIKTVAHTARLTQTSIAANCP